MTKEVHSMLGTVRHKCVVCGLSHEGLYAADICEQSHKVGGEQLFTPAPLVLAEDWAERITESVNPAAHDPVNSPSHYTAGGIETIDYLRAKLTPEEFRGMCRGNALKYVSRAPLKANFRQDIEKAIWYLNTLLSSLDA